jgi:membrane associated rhomboid family serine protease
MLSLIFEILENNLRKWPFSRFFFFGQVCVGALLLTLHWEILSTEISCVLNCYLGHSFLVNPRHLVIFPPYRRVGIFPPHPQDFVREIRSYVSSVGTIIARC